MAQQTRAQAVRRINRGSQQPRIPGLHRVPTWGSLHPKVRAALEREALRNGVSRSWVLNVNAAIGLGIDLSDEELY